MDAINLYYYYGILRQRWNLRQTAGRPEQNITIRRLTTRLKDEYQRLLHDLP